MGDVAGGLHELLEVGRLVETVEGHNPALVRWRSHAALACSRLGDQDEACRLAAEELVLARAWGAPRALGAALRAMGLVEGGADGLALLEEAVDVLAASPARLEHAKARTELGAALHRANRRSDARAQLRQALELATLCGATPLAARAETELRATGARPRRTALRGVEALTSSERRVAELAAKGPTNREIAQTLFVTREPSRSTSRASIASSTSTHVRSLLGGEYGDGDPAACTAVGEGLAEISALAHTADE
jgi:hypothetical protein